MIITSWNCHNLNSGSKEEIRKNRQNYRKILKNAIGVIPDVAFFCEVEREKEDYRFHKCLELDNDWKGLTSGISLQLGPDVTMIEEYLMLPANGSEEYGMAWRVKAAKKSEVQDIVFFWNLKRKYVKKNENEEKKIIHGYPAIWKRLTEILNRDEKFWNSGAIIMGDFNLTGEEVQKALNPLNSPMKIQWNKPSHFQSFPINDLASGRPLDHFICRDGQAECLEAIIFKDDGRNFVGKNLSDHLPLIIQTRHFS